MATMITAEQSTMKAKADRYVSTANSQSSSRMTLPEMGQRASLRSMAADIYRKIGDPDNAKKQTAKRLIELGSTRYERLYAPRRH